MTDEATTTTQVPQRSAIITLSDRLGVEPGELFMRSLRKVAFREDLLDAPVTNEQLMALVVVANQYKLNPFTRELYAFPDKKSGGIVPIVSIDGWLRIINEHPDMDGLEYTQGQDDEGTYGECTIYRKDRKMPTKLREYAKEVARGTDPWRQYPKRMLRHKTIIQTGRVAFGFSGIYEPDEADRIIEARQKSPLSTATMTQKGVDKLATLLGSEPMQTVAGVVESERVNSDAVRPDGDEDEREALRLDAQRGGELPI